MTDEAEFNWVRERHSCSAYAIFMKLKLEIEQDVAERNALRPEERWYGFRVVSHGAAFSVMREGNKISKSATFSIKDDQIVVVDDKDKVVLKASLTLNDDGECRFKIEGKERESWHLRKLVLEEMFFGSDVQ
jgi:hypothetical protein